MLKPIKESKIAIIGLGEIKSKILRQTMNYEDKLLTLTVCFDRLNNCLAILLPGIK
jgi:hypothetical protein